MKEKNQFIVGTRGSPLALRQTQIFVESLQKIHPDFKYEVKQITTSGDRIRDRFLSTVGGKGLFVKEIEEALIREEIDFAVHSFKDLPALIPQDLTIGCYPKRMEPWDVLVSQKKIQPEKLKSGALLGTTSLRRRSQLKRINPHLRFEILRGNIDTRLKKLKEGQFDAIVLAKAGLQRLGLELTQATDLNIVPAPGQGALAVEIRMEDNGLKKLLSPLHDPETQLEIQAERRMMRALAGNCNLPLGALARVQGGQIVLKCFVGTPDATKTIELEKAGPVIDSQTITDQLIELMLQKGAAEIMAACQEGIVRE